MATVGSLGDIVFSVSANQVKTISGLKRSISAQYSTHNRQRSNFALERRRYGGLGK